MERAEFLRKLTMDKDLQNWATTAFTVNNSSMYHYKGKDNPYLDKTVMQAREYSKYLQAKMEKDVLSGVEVAKQELPVMKKEIIDKSKKSMASMGYNKKLLKGHRRLHYVTLVTDSVMSRFYWPIFLFPHIAYEYKLMKNMLNENLL